MAAYAYKYVRDRLPQFIIDKQVDYEGAGRKPKSADGELLGEVDAQR